MALALLSAGIACSLAALAVEWRIVRRDVPHVRRLPPELHLAFAVVTAGGAWLLGGWIAGVAALVAQAVVAVAAAIAVDRWA